jgi:hypothetical protein
MLHVANFQFTGTYIVDFLQFCDSVLPDISYIFMSFDIAYPIKYFSQCVLFT